MRAHSELLVDVLSGSFDVRLHVDVFAGTDRVIRGLNVVGWSFAWDYSTVGFSGTLDVVEQTDDGVSLIPRGPFGVLSPHAGARVLLLMEVSAGAFSETVQLGWARVVGYTDARDTVSVVDGRRVVTATEIRLELAGIEVGVVRDGLAAPEQPPAGATCYSEIRRLSGLPVGETLPDKGAPALTYEAKQGGRWDACIDLAKHLGGTLYVTSQGGLTVHDPDVGLSVELRVGDEGTIHDYTQSADTDGVYNVVHGQFEDEAGNPIYATAELRDGPMAVGGGYGRYARYYSSDFVKTQDAADSAVRSILSQYTTGELYEVPVTCIVNPLVEVGDRVRASTVESTVEGIVTSVQLKPGALMQLTLEVARVW